MCVENMRHYGLTGLEKVHIILDFPFAEKILPKRDIRFIRPVLRSLSESTEYELKELAEEEQRAKAKGHKNHLSLEELVFILRDLHSLEEKKLFALFFLVHNVHVKLFEDGNFKQYAIENAPKLKPEELEIAGLSKEDVEKIIAMYNEPNTEAENNGKRN